MNTKDAKKFIEEDAKILKPCILCGRETHGRGMFLPPEGDYGDVFRVEMKPGKMRIIAYALCQNHGNPPSKKTFERIEKNLYNQCKPLYDLKQKYGDRVVVYTGNPGETHA